MGFRAGGAGGAGGGGAGAGFATTGFGSGLRGAGLRTVFADAAGRVDDRRFAGVRFLSLPERVGRDALAARAGLRLELVRAFTARRSFAMPGA